MQLRQSFQLAKDVAERTAPDWSSAHSAAPHRLVKGNKLSGRHLNFLKCRMLSPATKGAIHINPIHL
jgi:hypothetical protein